MPEELARRWTAGEERLYPVVMLRPELYAVALRLVRSVADRLHAFATEEELAAAYPEAAALVADVAAAEEIVAPDLDHGLVADAAFNLRRRQIVWRLDTPPGRFEDEGRRHQGEG